MKRRKEDGWAVPDVHPEQPAHQTIFFKYSTAGVLDPE
jgi:hypothetical protein